MDDSVETKRKLETLDLPEVDMTMTDGQVGIGNLEGDDEDDEDTSKMDVDKPKDAMVDEEDEVDPLDAFMSGVKEEVKKVNLEDMKKMNANGAARVQRTAPWLPAGGIGGWGFRTRRGPPQEAALTLSFPTCPPLSVSSPCHQHALQCSISSRWSSSG